MPAFTLISAEDPFETIVADAEAAVRAGFIADYLAAANAIDRAHVAYEIALYDAANPSEAPLMDEIHGLNQPAAA
ncbi:hypothetical protein [Streptomyces griseofuscus]|uniref:Uncharacterized protein n=1 Tax=Streptomyces griseofuscus TaxID=146922 RepID=A0A3R8R870_9ACTN|nr:hypothetical protein [Streptomyces griseofuscus]RRQ81536.1 hypothetical protein CQW44_30510 [Streptomyces griseofuscus]